MEDNSSHVDEVLLETIVRELVDYPHDVRVVRTTDEQGVLLSLHVHPTDMGKVIGAAGATAKALRTILRHVGMRHSARINLKIVEPYKPGEQFKTALADLDQIL